LNDIPAYWTANRLEHLTGIYQIYRTKPDWTNNAITLGSSNKTLILLLNWHTFYCPDHCSVSFTNENKMLVFLSSILPWARQMHFIPEKKGSSLWNQRKKKREMRKFFPDFRSRHLFCKNLSFRASGAGRKIIFSAELSCRALDDLWACYFNAQAVQWLAGWLADWLDVGDSQANFKMMRVACNNCINKSWVTFKRSDFVRHI
jgi:hypothetical protein